MPDHCCMCRSRRAVTAPDCLLRSPSLRSRHDQFKIVAIDCQRHRRILDGVLKLLAAVRFHTTSKIAWDCTCCTAVVEEAHERGQMILCKGPKRLVHAEWIWHSTDYSTAPIAHARKYACPLPESERITTHPTKKVDLGPDLQPGGSTRG